MFADLGTLAIHMCLASHKHFHMMLVFLILSRLSGDLRAAPCTANGDTSTLVFAPTLFSWDCGHTCRLRHGSFAADGLKHDLAGDTIELKSLFHQLVPGKGC